jgi:hypothetical protein
MVRHIPSPAKPSKSVAKFLPALAIGFMLLTASASTSSAQTFSRAFAVSPERSELDVRNREGMIKVTAVANSSKIVINARQSGGAAKIDATQNAMGKVVVEVTEQGKVDFEITVPASTNVNLLAYRGPIMVSNLAGTVHARVTEGDIKITGLRSAKVEAHCTQGNVVFSGEVLPSGSYILKSFSGRVEVDLPADADFKLSASSFSGGIGGLDAFPMKFDKRSPHLVKASRGAGGASINLWTQEGSIHLRRKP